MKKTNKKLGALRPPLNGTAARVLHILINQDDVLKQSNAIQELFTFRNVLRRKLYQLRYWIWQQRK